MTTSTLTLTDFLLTRIAQDEADKRYWLDHLDDRPSWGERTLAKVTAERVLAECEAKRRIVEASAHHAQYNDRALGDHCRANLALLASIYADHPDYREEWKP